MGWSAYVAHMDKVISAGLCSYERYLADMDEHGLREGYERFVDWKMKSADGALPPPDVEEMPPKRARAGAGTLADRPAKDATPRPLQYVPAPRPRDGWGE